jgi:hypothetical protein
VIRKRDERAERSNIDSFPEQMLDEGTAGEEESRPTTNLVGRGVKRRE